MTTFIFSLLVVLVASSASTRSAPGWVHTRPVTQTAARTIADAGGQAPIIKSMLERLERSDVFVYVSHHIGASPLDPPAYLRFVARAGGRRYLRVEINCWQTTEADRITWLGHELQHALEVASAAEVQDPAGMERFYQRIGYEVGKRQFETRAAKAVGNLVRDQLVAHQ